MESAYGPFRAQLGSAAREASELPGLRMLFEPLRRRLFQRPHRQGNDYFGVYHTHAEALAAARGFATPDLPPTYDLEAAGRLYRGSCEQIRACDYPLLYWLGRLLDDGRRSIFDLGGNIGVTYYGFRNYLDYPSDLRWLVHDLPAVVRSGREWARSHDPVHQLAFVDTPGAADGCDVLLSTGALQYLDYTLPELLSGLQRRPRNVLLNLTPMHPEAGFFTLQNLSIAICPYRVGALPAFKADMASAGYRLVDHWQTAERSLRIPFEPRRTVESYHGFCFELAREPAADN